MSNACAILFLSKNIFACSFSIHNTISLSRHEQVCLSGLCFERYFSYHWAFYFLVVGLSVESCCDDSEDKIVNDYYKMNT